jgi:hypothetical protein
VQIGNAQLTQKYEVKYLGMHLDRRLTWAKHVKTRTARPKSETNALATRKKINTINRKQTPPTQSTTQIHMQQRNSAMGDSLQFQHRNPPALSIQDSPIHSERTLVHKQPREMDTVFSEIKTWNTKYLRKLENHT